MRNYLLKGIAHMNVADQVEFGVKLAKAVYSAQIPDQQSLAFTPGGDHHLHAGPVNHLARFVAWLIYADRLRLQYLKNLLPVPGRAGAPGVATPDLVVDRLCRSRPVNSG